MPAKNSIKIYIEDGFYHVYNRGINKMPIFLDEQDYRVFFYFLGLYLLPKEDSINKIRNNIKLSEDDKNKKVSKILALNNFNEKIEILCFVLMPNHFHFLLRQKNKNDMKLFIKSFLTKYSQYYNKKYKRVGPVFQGRYKAILINKEEYLLHLSRYIHQNPMEIISKREKLQNYSWSSYSAYIYGKGPVWLNKDLILSFFRKAGGFDFSSYQGFVEGYKEKSDEEQDALKKLILE